MSDGFQALPSFLRNNSNCTNAQAFRGCLLLLGLLSGLLTGCTGEKDPNAVYIDPPVVVDAEGIDEDLATYLEQTVALIRQSPHSAALRGRLAMTYDVNAFRDSAIAMYQQASAIDPFEFSWHYFRAVLRGLQGEYELALEDVGAALAIDPEYIPAWLYQGTWLFELGRNDDARESFTKAIQLRAGSPAVLGLARIEALEGNHQGVLDLLQPYEQNFPHPEISRQISRSYAALGRSEEAEVAAALGSQVQQLQWIDPLLGERMKHVRGYGRKVATAQDLLKGGRVGESLSMLEELYKMNPDDEAVISSLAWAYQSTDQFQRASDLLKVGIEKFPEQYRFYTNLGYLMSQGGHHDEAQALLYKSIELHASNSDAYEQLGIVLMHKKQYDAALEAFELALQYGNRNNTNILMMKGTIEGFNKQWDAAIDSFQRVVQTEPTKLDAHIHLSYAYMESDQLEKARESLTWAERLGIPSSALQNAYAFLAAAEESAE